MQRARHIAGRYSDLAFAAALTALGECELFISSLNSDFRGPDAVNAVVVALIASPVIWRRSQPLAAFCIYAFAASVWLTVEYGPNANLPLEPLIVLLVLIYSAAAYVPPRQERAALVTFGLLLLSVVVLMIVGRKSVGNAVPGLVLMTLAYGLGRGLRRKQVLADTLADQAHGLRRQSAEQTRAAVADERNRIARELHDVIAHSVSVMVVQAGAGERLIASDTDAARGAFEAIGTAGREAIGELQRLLGLLRSADSDDQDPRRPGLGNLENVLEQARSSGSDVRCVIEGDPREVPGGIDLAAYRIIQEAFTNVRKHTQGAAVTLTLTYDPQELRIRIDDDGGNGRPGASSLSGGNGLIGMRERVALYGGALQAGTRSDGGFEIDARLPLAGDAA